MLLDDDLVLDNKDDKRVHPWSQSSSNLIRNEQDARPNDVSDETPRDATPLYTVLELYKHLRGDDESFSRKRKGGMVIIYRGTVYAEMFYGRMVLFSGWMASHLNSNTAYIVIKTHIYANYQHFLIQTNERSNLTCL